MSLRITNQAELRITNAGGRIRNSVKFVIPRGARERTGFTMVEVVILLGIFVLIAGIVLASFPRLSQRIGLQHSTQQLALALRRAQNMAFAVRQVSTPSGRVIPPAYGVFVARATPTSFVIFADLRGTGGTSDGLYRPAEDVAVETVQLDRGITFGELVSDLGGANQRQEVVNISFSVPEARMAIANASLPVGESVELFLVGRVANYTKSVTVRTSGQIYAR